MNVDQALQFVNDLLSQKDYAYLDDDQTQVFKSSWERKSYPEIANIIHKDSEYTKQIGSKLWKLLSKVLEPTINKKNFKSTIERLAKSDNFGKFENAIAESAPTVIANSNHPTDNINLEDNKIFIPDPNFIGREEAIADINTLINSRNAKVIGIITFS
jgi:hypothetical protein